MVCIIFFGYLSVSLVVAVKVKIFMDAFFFFLENIPKWVFLSNLDNFPSLFPSLLYLITFYQFLIYSMFLRLTFESCQLAFMCL